MAAGTVEQPMTHSASNGHGKRVIRVTLSERTCAVPLECLGIDSQSEQYDVIASVAGYFDTTYERFRDHRLVRNPDGSLDLFP